MRDRALLAAVFVAGVVTAVATGLGLMAGLRPAGRQEPPLATSRGTSPPPVQAPAGAWVPAPNAADALPRAVPADQARPGATEAPSDQPAEPPEVAPAQRPAFVPRAPVPAVPASPAREPRQADTPPLAPPVQPAPIAQAPFPAQRTDPADEAAARAVRPSVPARDLRLPPAVAMSAIPGPRDSLMSDMPTHVAAPGPGAESVSASAAVPSRPSPAEPIVALRAPSATQLVGAPTAADPPALVSAKRQASPVVRSAPAVETVRAQDTRMIVPTAPSTSGMRNAPSSVPMRVDEVAPLSPASLRAMPQAASGHVAPDLPVVRSGEAAASPSLHIAAPTARLDAPPPARRVPEIAPPSSPAPEALPTPASRVPRDVAALASPQPNASRPPVAAVPALPASPAPPAESARTAAAPAAPIEPQVLPRADNAPDAANPVARPRPPSGHCKRAHHRSRVHSRPRRAADALRSRAALGRPASAIRRRAPVTLLYGTAPYGGTGPVLIRIHRGRNGLVRTTRIPLD